MRCNVVLIAAVLCTVAVLAKAAVPVFPQSFTVDETDEIDVHQGDYTVSGNGVCCPQNSVDGCKVQVEEQAGINYQSASKKMQAFAPFGSDQLIVSDYNTQKQYLVQNGTCQEYCPLDDDEFPLFGPDPNSTVVPSKVINGRTCAGFFWKVTILGIVVMETSTFYTDVSNPSNPVPCAQQNELTPFGQDIGTEASLWNNWKPGEPDPKIFEFANKDGCQEGNDCNNDDSTTNLLRMRLYRTWLKRTRGIELPK